MTIKTSRNLIKGCNYLLDNLTVVRKDLLPSRFNKMNREWKRNILFLLSSIQTVNIQYSDINIQTSIFNFQTSIFNIQTSIFILFSLFKQLSYDPPHYSLFFYKSHVRHYWRLPRHNVFLCYAYYLLAEVVQKISNYKQDMLLVTLK